MVIRDDRKVAVQTVNGLPLVAPGMTRQRYPDHFAPDAVLHDCPDCNRSHFVTVNDCPDAATAAAEVAMADDPRKAA